jgi:hypothetical protein
VDWQADLTGRSMALMVRFRKPNPRSPSLDIECVIALQFGRSSELSSLEIGRV